MTPTEPPASRRRSSTERVLRGLAVAVGLGSCLPMLAMLPGGIATALAVVGVKSATGPVAPLARFLAPAARPLLLVGIAGLVLATLRCGLRPALLALAGGILLYLSMYVLPGTNAHAMVGMAGMTGPAHSLPATAARAGAHGMTNPPAFFIGLAALTGTFIWSAVRRRLASCRPVRRGLAQLSS